MNTILCRATADLGSKWLVVTGGPGSWNVEDAYGNLQMAVEAVTAALPVPGDLAFPPLPRKAPRPTRLDHDFSFTTRALEEALATYPEQPDDLPGLGLNSHAMIVCPEGGGIENRWATLHRVGMTGALVGTGLDGKFRPQCLQERVIEWFARQQWRSFVAPRISERHEPRDMQPDRPSHHRDLLVRHGWAAREIAPDAFPPLRLGPAITAEQEAKRLSKLPQGRAATRRLKHLENDARFKAEAAERARQREAAQ